MSASELIGELTTLKEAMHEDVELYCHYYNNDKQCPYMGMNVFLFMKNQTTANLGKLVTG